MKRVMVIDDDVASGMLLCRILERIGYSAELISDPLDAVKQSERFDAVVADYYLDDCIDGMSLLEVIRQYRPKIAAVIATANSSPPLAERAALAEMVYVLKPYVADDIAEALDVAIALVADP